MFTLCTKIFLHFKYCQGVFGSSCIDRAFYKRSGFCTHYVWFSVSCCCPINLKHLLLCKQLSRWYHFQKLSLRSAYSTVKNISM